MVSVRVYRLKQLPAKGGKRLFEAQQEAARCWNLCVALHLEARANRLTWPTEKDLRAQAKGKFALHSQTIQALIASFLAAIDVTRKLRKSHPQMNMRYPSKEKFFYPLSWPAQAVSKSDKKTILPMGKGRQSLLLPVVLPESAGACKLVWKDGYELHVCIESGEAQPCPGEIEATCDLGQIHQAAVTSNTGQALIVSGRGIRALKKQRNKALGQISKKRSRCHKGSTRWKKLQSARRKVTARTERRVKDLRHKGIRQVVAFCQENQVGKLFVGNPEGVQRKDSGRHQNQRMSQWEFGKDISYLEDKSKQAGIKCFKGTERGTSSHCPVCQWRKKPAGRNWVCKKCGFRGHRDLVGAVNMHPIAYGHAIEFPHRITYLRPGLLRKPRSSNSLDTGQCCLAVLRGQPLALQGTRRVRATLSKSVRSSSPLGD